jgi:hypothetical protein
MVLYLDPNATASGSPTYPNPMIAILLFEKCIFN